MIAKTGETYLWYFPDGTPSSVETSTSPEATATDGWGSSAMLFALVEGLCGVVDTLHSFLEVDFSPRWLAASEDVAKVDVSYAASGSGFAYDFVHEKRKSREGTLTFNIRAGQSRLNAHVLLPADVLTGGADAHDVAKVSVNGEQVPSTVSVVGNSRYVDFSSVVKGAAEIGIEYNG
jgi:hypothetical protein